jgi:hypothetical protein
MKKLLGILVLGLLLSSNAYAECIEGDCENGYGTFTLDGNTYVGEWKNGKGHGQGTLTWPDGNTYVGEWKNDKRHGQGTHTWPDGDKYVGEWKNDKKHGQGIFTKVNGKIIKGIFKKDKLVKELK